MDVITIRIKLKLFDIDFSFQNCFIGNKFNQEHHFDFQTVIHHGTDDKEYLRIICLTILIPFPIDFKALAFGGNALHNYGVCCRRLSPSGRTPGPTNLGHCSVPVDNQTSLLYHEPLLGLESFIDNRSYELSRADEGSNSAGTHGASTFVVFQLNMS